MQELLMPHLWLEGLVMCVCTLWGYILLALGGHVPVANIHDR